MTLDKSLKIRAGSNKQRNVLNRAERLTKLIENERFGENQPLYGMPKVRVTKISMKKKKKVKKEEDAAAAPAAAGDKKAAAKPAAKTAAKK